MELTFTDQPSLISRGIIEPTRLLKWRTIPILSSWELYGRLNITLCLALAVVTQSSFVHLDFLASNFSKARDLRDGSKSTGWKHLHGYPEESRKPKMSYFNWNIRLINNKDFSFQGGKGINIREFVRLWPPPLIFMDRDRYMHFWSNRKCPKTN